MLSPDEKLESPGEQNFIQKLWIEYLLAFPPVLEAVEDKYKDKTDRVSVPSLPLPQGGIKSTSVLSQQLTISKPALNTDSWQEKDQQVLTG